MSKAWSREVGRIFSLGFELQPPSPGHSPLHPAAFKAVLLLPVRALSGYRSTVQDTWKTSQTKVNPPKAQNQRPEHRVQLTPNHLVQYLRINTTHRIALLHVGTAVYRPSRRTPASSQPGNALEIWYHVSGACILLCDFRLRDYVPSSSLRDHTSYGDWAFTVD